MDAAEILYSSQSSLSKHIKSIETELGAPLFERTTRKVQISKYGQLLLPYAKQIADLQDKYNAVLQSCIETDRDILTLGSIKALAQYNITDIFVDFKKSQSQSTINILQGSTENLKEMLRQKKCELAFIRQSNEVDEDLVKIPYATDTLVAVLPASHAMAKLKPIQLQMLANEDFLLLEEQSYQHKLIMRICKENGFEPKVVFTDERIENLIELVIEGMGVAVLMKQLALYFASPKIAIVDIIPTVSTQICLCYLKDTELSFAAKHFVQCAGRISRN